MSDIQRVGVVGCGLMGSGIAEVLARAGLPVLVAEVDQTALGTGRARVERSLGRAVRAGRLSEAQAEQASSLLTFTTDLGQFADRQLVVEAVNEDEGLKLRTFSALDAVVQDDQAVLASNTSTLSIARLGAATSRPHRVLGLHFFNPAPVMALVEVTPSLATDEKLLQRAESFVGTVLSKEVVRAKDRAGFVVNVLLVPYLLSAVRMLDSGVASATDIDLAMRSGCAYPMGPLALADLVGLDTLAFSADVLYDEYKEASFVAPPLLRRMVEAGRLGRKTGSGFYNYE